MREASISLANVEALRRSSEEYREALRGALDRVASRGARNAPSAASGTR
ncbi:MAG: hypothetical protein O3B31_08830 [Chloroflexi bacterium]|nr:hypothetical protein [Chloroflexota bacterium]